MSHRKVEFGPDYPYRKQERRDFYALPNAEYSYGSQPQEVIQTPVCNRKQTYTTSPIALFPGDY